MDKPINQNLSNSQSCLQEELLADLLSEYLEGKFNNHKNQQHSSCKECTDYALLSHHIQNCESCKKTIKSLQDLESIFRVLNAKKPIANFQGRVGILSDRIMSVIRASTPSGNGGQFIPLPNGEGNNSKDNFNNIL